MSVCGARSSWLARVVDVFFCGRRDGGLHREQQIFSTS